MSTIAPTTDSLGRTATALILELIATLKATGVLSSDDAALIIGNARHRLTTDDERDAFDFIVRSVMPGGLGGAPASGVDLRPN